MNARIISVELARRFNVYGTIRNDPSGFQTAGTTAFTANNHQPHSFIRTYNSIPLVYSIAQRGRSSYATLVAVQSKSSFDGRRPTFGELSSPRFQETGRYQQLVLWSDKTPFSLVSSERRSDKGVGYFQKKITTTVVGIFSRTF